MKFLFIPVLFTISIEYVLTANTISGGNYTSNTTQIYEWIFQTGARNEGFDGWKMMYPFKINDAYVPYMEPNLTIYRRIFNIGLEFIRKLFRGDVKTEEQPNENSDALRSGNTLEENDLIPTRRTVHEVKLAEITAFLKDHQLTTNYFYEEMQRILAQRIVKDDLRNMVTYLDDPNQFVIKSKVLKYYTRLRARDLLNKKRKSDLYETNNLAITISNNY